MKESLRNIVLTNDINIKHLIISDENLLGPMLGHRFAGDYVASDCYLGAPLVFDVVNNLFKENLVSISLTRRDFCSWRISVYKDLIMKLKESVSPTQYINRISQDSETQFNNCLTN
jgi:hypothetical protein